MGVFGTDIVVVGEIAYPKPNVITGWKRSGETVIEIPSI